MDTHENYRNRGMTEGHPGNINPDEINTNTPAKAISETERLERNESALGINQSKKASSENFDEHISQIDDETRKIQQDLRNNGVQETEAKQFDTDDSNRVDARDRNDSTTDWDAEQNRTGRQR